MKNKSNKKNNKHVRVSRFVMAPDCTFRVVWDILCMVLIFYEMIMIPFRLSFQEDIPHGQEVPPDQEIFKSFENFDLVFDLIFLTDIMFNFNTAIYQKGILIFDRKQITLSYMMMWFWLDLFSSFPYSLVLTSLEDDENSDGGSSSN